MTSKKKRARLRDDVNANVHGIFGEKIDRSEKPRIHSGSI